MINPTSLHFGEIIYPPGSTLGPRRQQTYELVLVYHGTLTVLIDGVPLTVGPNHVILLFPGHEEHFYFATQCETHHTWVHLALPDLAKDVAERLAHLTQLLHLSVSLRMLMDQLLALRTCPLPTAEELMKLVAAQMLWCYVGEAEQISQKNQGHLRAAPLVRVQDYVYVHLHETLTLHRLTQVASISAAQLTRLFRRQVGQTPLEYVWQQRVKRGVDLLEHTGLTVEEVATRCGFKTSYHFSRRVKAITGCTPTQIRRQASNLPGLA